MAAHSFRRSLNVCPPKMYSIQFVRTPTIEQTTNWDVFLDSSLRVIESTTKIAFALFFLFRKPKKKSLFSLLARSPSNFFTLVQCVCAH